MVLGLMCCNKVYTNLKSSYELSSFLRDTWPRSRCYPSRGRGHQDGCQSSHAKKTVDVRKSLPARVDYSSGVVYSGFSS